MHKEFNVLTTKIDQN